MIKVNIKEFMNIAGIKLISFFALLICIIVGGMSFFSTAVFEKGKVETIEYNSENIILLIISMLFFLLLLYFLYRRIHWSNKTIKILRIIMILYIMTFGMIWIYSTQSLPFADGELVDQATTQFANNNFELLNKGQYFDKFPFQLNLVFVFDTLYKVFGYQNYIVLQMLNIACLAGTYYYFCKSISILFENKKYEGLLIILLILWLPALLYCSFIYSTMYGLFLSTLASYYGLKYLKTRNTLYFIHITLAISMAIMLKSNYLITLIALMCILIMDFINHKKLASIVLIVLMLVFQSIPTKLIHRYYEDLSGKDIGKGIPNIAWIAMGMQEGNKASGWYNSLMFDAYKQSNYDSDITKAICIQNIKERIGFFKSNPKELLLFYRRKINSQWNEPTYESLWVSEHRKGMHAIPLSEPIKSLYYGDLHKIYIQYANVFQFIVVLSSAICFWISRKKITYEQLSFAIILIGGFLFHLIWEGNSKYILPYFLLLMPYSSIGLCNLFDKFHSMLKR